MKIKVNHIINFLFLISFSIIGLASFFESNRTGFILYGRIFSILPFILILLTFIIDFIRRSQYPTVRNLTFSPTKYFYLFCLFLLSAFIAKLYGLANGIVLLNPFNIAVSTLSQCLPFFAAIIFIIYNTNGNYLIFFYEKIKLSILLLFLLNIGGLILGIKSNGAHIIEGRINLPFVSGVYTGSNLASIIGILYLPRILEFKDPKKRWSLIIFCIACLVLLGTNSRLNILIFLLTISLAYLNVFEKISNLIFIFSWTFLPFLLNGSKLIYETLSLPLFSSILKRTSYQDITSFNGRADLWNRTIEWLKDDRTNLLFGNGYRGHYTLRFFNSRKFVQNWGGEKTSDAVMLHLHSSTAEIIVCQGVLGLCLFGLSIFGLIVFLQKNLNSKSFNSKIFRSFLYVILFLLLMGPVDSLMYDTDLGFVIFSICFAPVAIKTIKK